MNEKEKIVNEMDAIDKAYQKGKQCGLESALSEILNIIDESNTLDEVKLKTFEYVCELRTNKEVEINDEVFELVREVVYLMKKGI